VKLNARVTTMPNGSTVVICSSPTPITEFEKPPILAQINQEYPVESSLFLSHGVIVRVIDRPQPRGRRGR